MHSLQGALQFYVSSEPYHRTRLNASKLVFQIRTRVHDEFQQRTRSFHRVVSVLKKLVPLSILLLIYVSYLHVKLYTCRDGYDNIYIGDEFVGLDQRRAEVAGESLLPLKKYERRYVVDLSSSQLSPSEEGLYQIGLCVLFLNVLISLSCYLFDYILYWVLAVVERHGRPDVDVTARDSLDLVVTGDGIIVELLHIFLDGFHPGRWLDFHPSNAMVCLPSPSHPSIVNLLVLAVIYVVFTLTIVLKAYLLRLRHKITGYFFTDREKARVVHLYRSVNLIEVLFFSTYHNCQKNIYFSCI